ncbi:hypothetical protein EBT16_05075, partial [bacterium]|nr:hypothetical protein [bacterium]
HISKEHQYIFFSDPDLRWVRKVLDVMGLLPENTSRVFSWVYEIPQEDQLRNLEPSGIDEVICIRDRAEEMGVRLELRSIRSYQKGELKRQVRELLMKEARAETVLSQREEFLSVCAHDLRSPLGLIHSSLSLLLTESKNLNSTQEELVERSKRQSEHGIRLVNDLLDVMAYEQGLKPDYQLVDMDQFLRDLYKDYAFQAKQKDIELKYDNSLSHWKVLMDPDRIHQLLQNLLVNAIKFTEPGKRIYLSVFSFKGRRRGDPPYPMLIVGVRDEGRGIPEEEAQKIFNRFSQIKDYSRMEGRGLGLSVAKQISHLHDGNLWVKSVEGEGSTFFVLFPHVVSEPKKQEKDSKKQKILVVDSEKEQRLLLSDVVSRWGFEALQAKDGIEMVTLANFYQPNVVLVGSKLPKLTDENAAKIIKEQLKMDHVPIFACLAPGTVFPVNRENSPIDGSLRLPLDRLHLERALNQFQEDLKKKRKKAA